MVLGETFKEVGAAGVAGWSCRRGWGGMGLQAWLGGGGAGLQAGLGGGAGLQAWLG